VTQHADLDAERWRAFDIDQQILTIANEMNRACRAVERGDVDATRRGYERILRLLDLTVEVGPRPALLRELLRWRDLIADLYGSSRTEARLYRTAFRALLQLRPNAAKQIPLLLRD